MAVYAVHAPPGDLRRSELAERVVFVREGFAVGAFLVPGLYLLVHRAWLPFFLYAVGLVGMNFAAAALGASFAVVLIVNLIYAALFGIEAAGLRQWSLARKGLDHVASVVARRTEDAEMRFFKTLDGPVPAAEPGPPARAAGRPRETTQALLFAEEPRR